MYISKEEGLYDNTSSKYSLYSTSLRINKKGISCWITATQSERLYLYSWTTQSQQRKEDVEALCENTAYNIIHRYLSQATKRSGLLKMSSFYLPSSLPPVLNSHLLFFGKSSKNS